MKSNDEKYDAIKAKFDNCPDLPEGLKRDNVISLLKGTKQEKLQKISLSKIGSIAAVVAVVMLSVFTAGSMIGKNITPDTTTTSQKSQISSTTAQESNAYHESVRSYLRLAESRKELENIILARYEDNKDVYNDLIEKGSDFDDSIDRGSSAQDAGSLYSETNAQALGIDEGDIIKNDGKYLYVVSVVEYAHTAKEATKLRIIDSESMKVVYDSYLYSNEGDILTIREIYLSGNNLIAVGTYGNDIGDDLYCYAYNYAAKSQKTVSIVMDITNKSEPKIIRRSVQDGVYVSSRMADGILYTVTQYAVSGENDSEIKNNCVPSINSEEISCDCIYIIDDNSTSYICLSACDTANSSSEISTLAVLGDAHNVYCSQNNLYVVASKISDKDSASTQTVCVINSFSLDGTKISFNAQGKVNGYISSQYNMDEYDGTLRVVTTGYDGEINKDVCSLYVLDNKLEVIGKLEDIADDETVKGVRFMGKTAYVVTFKNTDPLFVIDLKDPSQPKIKGKIKLPGFSAYLHPISESLILGIGYDGNEEKADETSVKVSLFDVSDMASPKVISSFTRDDAYCRVVDDPKAFIYNTSESYIALPIELYDYNLKGYGCYIISLENDELTLKYTFNHDVDDVYAPTFIRGAYIGDSFFTISDSNVYKYSLADGAKKGECNMDK